MARAPPSTWKTPQRRRQSPSAGRISAHASLVGCDLPKGVTAEMLESFTRAPLAWCDMARGPSSVPPCVFLPTPPCGGATRPPDRKEPVHQISTHAPLAECDLFGYVVFFWSNEFLPTRPLRGATTITADDIAVRHISTHTRCKPAKSYSHQSHPYTARGPICQDQRTASRRTGLRLRLTPPLGPKAPATCAF